MSGSIVALISSIKAPSGSGRTVISSSTFTQADGFPTGFTDLADGFGGVGVISNQLFTIYGFPADASDNAAGFTNDGYAKITVSGLSGTGNLDELGVIGRASADIGANRDMYRAKIIDGANVSLILEKVLNNTVTNLGTNTTEPWANGDTVEIEYVGTTIKALRNGTAVITVTDSSLTTGRPGLFARAQGNESVRGDNYEAGNIP